jgi:ATP-dependent Clp protease ATP-binding subunit ClpB
MLKEKHIEFSVTEDAVETLSNKGYNPQFGARPIKRIIQKEVLNELSKQLLGGNIKPESHILLDAFNEELVFRNK